VRHVARTQKKISLTPTNVSQHILHIKVTSYVQISHVTHVNVSRRTYKWVTSLIQMRHAMHTHTRTNEYVTHKWVLPLIYNTHQREATPPAPWVCKTLQRTLQHTATHTASHCNTLQHPATYCNTISITLQHTATHSRNTHQRKAVPMAQRALKRPIYWHPPPPTPPLPPPRTKKE